MTGNDPQLRDYYAAERTLLAWIRTTIALMGFGFVVARFGVFLREIRTIEHSGGLHSAGLSVWFGTILIAFGVVINIIAVRVYRKEIQSLNHGVAARRPTSILALWTAFGLAALGVVMAAYLIVISEATSG